MDEITNKKIDEQKLITRYIFQGFTNVQIAQKMHCSRSTIQNRTVKLFAKYNARTRFEFILGVLGEIVRNNKAMLDENNYKINDLMNKLEDLTLILRNIIIHKNNKESFEYWLKQAKDKLL